MLVPKFWPSLGGLQWLSYNIARRLAGRGHRVTVYTSLTKGTANGLVDGIGVVRFRQIHTPLPRPTNVIPGMLPKYLQEKCDIVHAFGLSSFHSLVASTLRWTTGAPLVLHPIAHSASRLYSRSFGRLILESADAIIAQCQSEKQNVAELVGNRKTFVIPCGIDASAYSSLPDGHEFRRRHGIGPNDKVVFYVGSTGLMKGVGDLVRIMPRILRTVESAKLAIVDRTANFERLRKIASDLGVSKDVLLLGRTSAEDLIGWYSAADLFAFPSRSESFGMVLVEAAAAGLPLVSTRVGVAPDLVKDGYSGFICEECDDTYADKVAAILIDREYHEHALSLRTDILEKYDWEVITDQVEDLYTRM